jgi:glutamine synthetase
MEVFIKFPDGIKTITLVVEADNTINMVKGIVTNMDGIPKHEQILKFADETLEDDSTLTENGIVDGSTITLVILTKFE